VKALGLPLVALAAVALQAQTAAPSAGPATTAPYRPRPVIIVNPRDYLARPTTPAHGGATARPHPTPRRRPRSGPTPEVFEHLETAPSAAPRR
jgi:hypothetical protein